MGCQNHTLQSLFFLHDGKKGWNELDLTKNEFSLGQGTQCAAITYQFWTFYWEEMLLGKG